MSDPHDLAADCRGRADEVDRGVVYHATVVAVLRRAADLIDAIDKLHLEQGSDDYNEWHQCRACWNKWRCATRRLLDGEADDE